MHATTISQVVVPSGDTISLKTFIFVCSNLGVSFKTEFNHMTRLNTCHPILRELQTTNNLLNKNAVTTLPRNHDYTESSSITCAEYSRDH